MTQNQHKRAFHSPKVAQFWCEESEKGAQLLLAAAVDWNDQIGEKNNNNYRHLGGRKLSKFQRKIKIP